MTRSQRICRANTATTTSSQQIQTETNSRISPQQQHPDTSVSSRCKIQHIVRSLTMKVMGRLLFLRVPLVILLLTMLDETYHTVNKNVVIISTHAYTTVLLSNSIDRVCYHSLLSTSSTSFHPTTSTTPSHERRRRRQRLSFVVPPQLKLQFQQSKSLLLLSSSSSSNSNMNDNINGSGSNQSSPSSSTDNDGLLQKKLEEDAKKMKVGELKQQLESQGISTKTFIEKSEFIKAYVQLMMNGGSRSGNVNNSNTKTNTKSTKEAESNSSSTGSNKQQPRQSETKDPTYRDVVVYKMNRSDPRMLQGTMIDITIKK